MSFLAKKRLEKELKNMQEINHKSLYRIEPFETTACAFKWHAYIIGPIDTPYENYEFKLLLTFTDKYPYSSPDVQFITPIYHCNISKRGYICMNILTDGWTPALTIDKILLSIISMLSDPNPLHPLEPDIAELYLVDKTTHDNTAIAYTQQHAKLCM